MRVSDPGVGARTVALIAVVVLAVLGVATISYAERVEVRSGDAPADVFSADRARDVVAPILTAPRVPGTAEHDQARDYLVAQLSGLGWQVEVPEGIGRIVADDDPVEYLGRVRNIVATLPGTDATGTVMLAAHYDTVSGSPGAADDGIGVATALEAARALTESGPHRNTIAVLLTDGEEAGLLGAESLSSQLRQAASEAPVVVLNNEARGSSGLPAIFRTGSPNGELLRILSGIRGAAADTGAQAAFELLPNDTDFTRFEEAGLSGWDAAITGSSANYHSVTDTPDRLSSESLQRMGEVSLSAAGELASIDLASVDAADSMVAASVVDRTIRAPQWVELALVVVTVVAAVILVVVRRRVGSRRTGLVAAAAVGVAAVPIGALAAMFPWWVTAIANPTMVSSVVGDPYRPGALQVAAVLTTLVAAGTLITLSRKFISAAAIGTGLLIGATVVVMVAAALPGFGLTFGVAVLVAIIGAIAAHRAPPILAAVITAVAAIPAVVILAPFTAVMFEVGLEMGGAAAGLGAVVLLACVYPLIDVLLHRRGSRSDVAVLTPLLAGVLAVVVCVGVSVVANESSSRQPIQEVLAYSLNADTDSALFVGSGRARSDWAHELLPTRGVLDVPGQTAQEVPYGPAPVLDLPAPEAEVVSDSRDGDRRTMEVRLRSQRDAAAMYLRIPDDVRLDGLVVVDGREVASADGAERSGLTMRFAGAAEVTVRLTVLSAGDTVDMEVSDSTPDVSVVPELAAPDNVVVNTPAVYVTRTARL